MAKGELPMPVQVDGFRARRLGGNGQWLALVGLEVLGHGGVGEMVLERLGADEAQLGIERDEPACRQAGPRSKARSWRAMRAMPNCFQQKLDPLFCVCTLVSTRTPKFPSTMRSQTYTITLSSIDLGQMLDGIEQRALSYRHTEHYHAFGEALSDDIIEEVSDADEARQIAEHFERIMATVQEQIEEQDKK